MISVYVTFETNRKCEIPTASIVHDNSPFES